MKNKRVLVAPDSFKGTLHAAAVARTICSSLGRLGIKYDSMPMSDGGEGFADVIAEAIEDGCERNAQVSSHTATVTGPAGNNVLARYYQVDETGQPMTAIMDCASASGLALAGGVENNDPIIATSRGTGELISDAINSGAQVVLVGLGGSATTDGGKSAVEAVNNLCKPDDVKIIACYDVKTHFTEAARVFAPQKGATPEQVDILDKRLKDLAGCYKAKYGIDVTGLTGGGAAGGLGGGLTLLGAELAPGFKVVAEYVHLEERLKTADLVITGEGRLDATSFNGKVVGSIIEMANGIGIPVAVIAGSIDARIAAEQLWAAGSNDARRTDMSKSPVRVISLEEQFGKDESFTDTAGCIERAVYTVCG